jgi:lysophospholipase L1-like esterase
MKPILVSIFVLFLSSGLFGQVSGNSPNTTIFIGDSITAFGNAPETNQDQSYGWGWTAQAVFLSNGSIEQIYNAGVPGQTSTQIASRFQNDVIARNPGTVVIMAGTNDATTGDITLAQLQATTANLKSMIDQAKQADIQPIICTVPPRSDAANYNLNVQKINGAIHKLAQAERVMLVDFYSILVDPGTGVYKSGYDLGDGIHPSPTAAKAMAQYFITATANLFGPSQEAIVSTTGDGTNLIPNPLFLTSDSAWTSNNYGSSPPPTYGVQTGDPTPSPAYVLMTGYPAISGNWFSFTLPGATAAGQYYAVNGPSIAITQGHHMAYSFKFQISGLQENGGYLNMGYAYGATNFAYNYMTDSGGVFYIEFTAPGDTFVPGFYVYPTVNSQPIQVRIGQISLVDLSAVGY